MDAYGQKYFITFIDDYSRYMHLYMLHNKTEALEAFKFFKAEVEKQCENKLRLWEPIEVVNIMVDIQKMDKHKVRFRSFFNKIGLLPNILSWLSVSEWCSRKKSPNIIGHGV